MKTMEGYFGTCHQHKLGLIDEDVVEPCGNKEMMRKGRFGPTDEVIIITRSNLATTHEVYEELCTVLTRIP